MLLSGFKDFEVPNKYGGKGKIFNLVTINNGLADMLGINRDS
jgi:hypothetical protein